MSPRLSGSLFAITTGLSWSILAIGLKYALTFASSGTIVWVRMAVAFATVGMVFLIFDRKQLSIFKALPWMAVVAGFMLAINYFGYMKGVELTTASNTQIMIQTGPMTLLLTGIFYFKETPSRPQIVGIFFALLGFALFYWDQWLQSTQDAANLMTGNLWILLAAMTWVLFASFQKILGQRWTPQQINLVIYTVCPLVLCPLVDWGDFHELPPLSWVILILLGLNTVLAYGCFGEAMKRIPASHVSLIVSCNPLITLFLIYSLHRAGWLFIDYEPVDWRGRLGALLVVCGVCLGVAFKGKPVASEAVKPLSTT